MQSDGPPPGEVRNKMKYTPPPPPGHIYSDIQSILSLIVSQTLHIRSTVHERKKARCFPRIWKRAA